MKFGLDIHGVINKHPGLFAKLTRSLIAAGHEVHILTGVELGARLDTELKKFNVSYTHLFSITSYHKSIGTEVAYKDESKRNPFIEPALWDRTKADYCKTNLIDIHIDDSTVYGNYFVDIDTQYILFTDGLSTILSTLLKKD